MRYSPSFHYCQCVEIARLATSLLGELAVQGLTVFIISDLEALNAAFDTAIDEVDDAVMARGLHTYRRVVLGNELWRHVNELASIGKSIFADTEEARYNDYLIS